MGILAGTAMRTMDIVDRSVTGRPSRRRPRYKSRRPTKLRIPKSRYNWHY